MSKRGGEKDKMISYLKRSAFNNSPRWPHSFAAGLSQKDKFGIRKGRFLYTCNGLSIRFHAPWNRMGLLPDTQNYGLPMLGMFSPPPRVSLHDMHHGTCVTHVPWCMPGSLTSGFLWSRWRGKRSRHSWRLRNPPFCVSGKRPILKQTSSRGGAWKIAALLHGEAKTDGFSFHVVLSVVYGTKTFTCLSDNKVNQSTRFGAHCLSKFITRAASWDPDRRKWLFSAVSVGIWTPIHLCW